jgi:hypothetical protein
LKVKPFQGLAQWKSFFYTLICNQNSLPTSCLNSTQEPIFRNSIFP